MNESLYVRTIATLAQGVRGQVYATTSTYGEPAVFFRLVAPGFEVSTLLSYDDAQQASLVLEMMTKTISNIIRTSQTEGT